MSQAPPPALLMRSARWRRVMELLFWLLLVLVNCSGNAITTWMDANRSGAASMQWWEPWVWEFSSGLVWLLLLVPAIVWFSRRWPLHLDNWRQRLPWYLLASVPISLLHVLAMFALRMLAYAAMGERYQVGVWSMSCCTSTSRMYAPMRPSCSASMAIGSCAAVCRARRNCWLRPMKVRRWSRSSTQSVCWCASWAATS